MTLFPLRVIFRQLTVGHTLLCKIVKASVQTQGLRCFPLMFEGGSSKLHRKNGFSTDLCDVTCFKANA